MSDMKRVPLYDRLPEIYRVRDAEQLPPGQLQAYLGAMEGVFGALHGNVEALYDDLFVDTCDDHAIPYIADLLGTTHLKGDARTLRADLVDTIVLRRRKGTLGAIERLANNLTGWPCHAGELFPNLGWTQHLNHQRPDRGGAAAYGGDHVTRFEPRRGGTVSLRDPAMLSLIGTAFDPFAYTADVKRADDGVRHVNLPNLAIYLWRLAGYRLAVTRPLLKGVTDLGAPDPGSARARFALRFDLDPLDRPVRLFNTYQRPVPDPVTGQAPMTALDSVAAPILAARLNSDSQAGNPAAYVAVDPFEDTANGPQGLDIGDVGLQLYHPENATLNDVNWRFRAANLCAWETGLSRELNAHDMVIDPSIGRVVIGLASVAQRNGMVQGGGINAAPRVFFGYTYGGVGPIGAQPVSRDPALPEGVELVVVNGLDPNAPTLTEALSDLQNRATPLIVEIRDSLLHDLDPAALPGTVVEGGLGALRLARSLTIRAASGARPVIRLATPLAFRPVDPAAATPAGPVVRLEGVFVTTVDPVDPVIARAAVARLELDGTTLDPGGHALRDGGRAVMRPAMRLTNAYGFDDPNDADAFAPTPDILISHSVTGALAIDDGYQLSLTNSVVDAGQGPGDAIAVRAAIGPVLGPYGAPLTVQGVTVLGRCHVKEARGAGGIFAGRLVVWNHQVGCLKLCYFEGQTDRLPPNHACVSGADSALRFTSIMHGQPGYAQLARGSDARLLTRGPGDDAMGATGFLLEAHKRSNLDVRLGEFMPVGVRPLVLTLT